MGMVPCYRKHETHMVSLQCQRHGMGVRRVRLTLIRLGAPQRAYDLREAPRVYRGMARRERKVRAIARHANKPGGSIR